MPASFVDQIQRSNAAWVDEACKKPLLHPNGTRVYLATTCCWAPLGW